MGKPTGFIEWTRTLPPKREKKLRIHDSREFYFPQAPEHSREQAARCMDCGVPFCHQGCPLGNQIPDWNELVYRDRWQAAFHNLSSTNNFPEFTGRLCPAPCEAACVLAINQDAVTIEEIEKDIAERAWSEGWVVARPVLHRSGKRVAVVGSGPAGLAAAAQLNQAGHLVNLYERSDRLGGLLRYGIPDFKLEKSVIDRRLQLLEAEGVIFLPNSDVGGALSWQEVRDTHDATVIAIGAGQARDLDVPGRDLGGVYLAMDYLEQQNRVVAGDTITRPRVDANGLHVVVLGGGDTGSDCVGTAHRQRAASVTQAELLPRPPDGRTADNPWPQWPMVFRTSSSQEEGGTREFSLMTKRLSGKDGRIDTLHYVRAEMVKDGAGRSSLREIPDSEQSTRVDLLLLALGFTGAAQTAALSEQLGVVIDPRGNIAVDAQYRTNVPGVFCAGDARKGASLVVWAIADGRETARSVDAFLAGHSSLPARGMEAPFGGR
jgi:glutamate synthase (NADPH/NADH) small chain